MTQNIPQKRGPYGDIAVSLTNPNSLAMNSFATMNLLGRISVSTDAQVVFADPFEGSTIETTNRWTTSGTVTPSQTTGALSFPVGATASATSAITSQPTFSSTVPTLVGWSAKFEATTIALGSHRFMGLGTVNPAPGTSTAPLMDGVGFEIDTSGVLRASIYSNNTRIWTSVLTAITDGLYHTYGMLIRGDYAFFHIDNFDVPLAYTSTTNVGARSDVLPFRAASLNSASVTAATPALTITGVAIMDNSRASTSISDGAYPWRKISVTKFGAQYTNPGPSLLPAYSVVGEAAATLVANTRKDLISLYHAATATKTVKIRRITLAAYNTSAVTGYVYARIFYGTTASTAGNGLVPTKNNEASAAAEVTCTSLPTITAATEKYTCGIGQLTATTGVGVGPVTVYDSTAGSDMDALTLRAGVAESIAIAIYSTGANALQPLLNVQFTEE